MTRHWLFKSEPESYGFDRLTREGRTEWSGVRNYQARNNMVAMRVGDEGFFYHSSTAVPAIIGIVRVTREAYPDFTALDASSPYHDERVTPEKPIWQMVDVVPERALLRPVTLAEIRAEPRLADMVLVQRGSRLSVQPVTAAQWKLILRMSER